MSLTFSSSMSSYDPPPPHSQGRSVHTYNMLVEARGMCNPLRSSEHVYDTLTNKLVYISGKLSTVEVWCSHMVFTYMMQRTFQ